MKEASTLLVALLLSACAESTPRCSFTGEAIRAVSAGCLVRYEDTILLVEIPGAQFSPPGGSVDEGESAQCTAERETFEEAGVRVSAGDLAQTFDNGFYLFWCEPTGSRVVNIASPLEITSGGWYSAAEFNTFRWRFPGQQRLIAKLLNEQLED